MEPETVTVTVTKHEYVGVALALGVASQLLVRAYGFDVVYWTEYMTNSANQQLAGMTQQEIDAVVARREELKQEVTNNEHNHN